MIHFDIEYKIKIFTNITNNTMSSKITSAIRSKSKTII